MKFVNLPLYQKYDYNYSINLEGESYNLRFTYNQIMKLYTLSVSDQDGNKLISGVGLVPNYPILLDYNVSSLTGAIVMVPNSEVDVEYYKLYPDQIHRYYSLNYFYELPT